MKHLILIFCWLVAFDVTAQQIESVLEPASYDRLICRSSFGRIQLQGKNNVEIIEKFLVTSLLSLKDERSQLKLNYRHESIGGYHYSFAQTFSGIPVYQSEIKVNTDKGNTILSIFDNSYFTKEWQVNTEPSNEHSIIVLHPQSGAPILATLDLSLPYLERIQFEGEVLHQRDTRMFFAAGIDSTVSGKVFNPDPLTTAGHLYDTNTVYKNNNNANASWIEAELQTVTFKANFDGIKFTLESPYAVISDFDTPQVVPVTSTLPLFNFSRPQTGLEDVNAFFHVSRIQKYVSVLGFDCSNKKINLDTHAAYGADQSYFSPNYIPPRIYYGTGGVPDAQDADVVVHEYGHFLSENASPVSNIGYQRTSLDEAFCDYLAASYSRSLNTFNQDWVFNWDGHNEFWNGRTVNADKHYPEDLSFESIYRDGEMWSSTLFQLNKDLGRGVTDSLIFETHYNYAQNISMTDAAQILINTDSLLYGGAHYCTIFKRLYERGLIAFRSNPCGISSIGETTDGKGAFRVTQDGNSFTLTSEAPAILDIYSINGAKLFSFSVNSPLTYRNSQLPVGMYVVYVRGQDASGAFKWVKTN